MSGKDDKQFDVICLGRAGVDLYADQIGPDLKMHQAFQNILVGLLVILQRFRPPWFKIKYAYESWR